MKSHIADIIVANGLYILLYNEYNVNLGSRPLERRKYPRHAVE
jgi:hypothetical protein